MKNRPPFDKALTFDDVLLVPKASDILPRDVIIKCVRLSVIKFLNRLLD